MAPRSREISVTQFIAIVSLLQALAVLFRLLLSGALRTHLATCCSHLAAALRCSTQEPPDAVILFVRRERAEWRQGAVQRLCLLLCFFFVPLTLYFANFRQLVTRQIAMTQAQLLSHVVQHAFVGVVALFPRVVTVRNSEAICCGFVAAAIFGQTPWTSSLESYMVWTARCGTMWLVICVAQRRPGWLMLLLLVLYGLCSFVTVRKLRPTPMQALASLLVFMLQLMAFSTCRVLEAREERRQAALLRGDDSKASLSAARALLQNCCDVVMELDEEGLVSKHSTELASFLLRGTSLEGTELAELLVEEAERRGLREMLRGESTADRMLVTVRDGNNSLLRLELSCFSFRRFDGELNFMVGLREHAEAAPAEAAPAEPPLRLVTRRSGSFPESEASEESCPDPVVAVLDCGKPGFPVRELSPGFCMQVGRLPKDSKITEHLRQPAAFERWMRRSVKAMAEGDEVLEQGKVRLKMPQGEVSAKVELLEEASVTDEGLCVGLRFRHIRLKSGPGHGAVGGRRSLASSPTASVVGL